MEVSLLKFPADETSLIIIQHWFKWWLGAVRQQAIIWTNVDPVLCFYVVQLGHNEWIWQPCLHNGNNSVAITIIRNVIELMEMQGDYIIDFHST